MLRSGEISPSLALFREAHDSAERLEAEKALWRRSWALGGAIDTNECGRCEDTMDRAWGLVADIERGDGPLVADMVTEHWLLGMEWRDVAVRHGLSPDKCKKLAYEAVKRLDGR